MKIAPTAITVVAVASLALAGCSTAKPEDTTSKDSGVDGISVPNNVVNEQHSGNTYTADMKGWTFEDAAQWMGKHMPDSADGLPLHDAARKGDAHEWCFAGDRLPSGGYNITVVRVNDGNPVNVTITRGDDDPSGC